MSPILAVLCIWSLLMGIANWSYAVKYILKGDYAVWTTRVGQALMFTVVFIDSFLRIFSPLHTGLW